MHTPHTILLVDADQPLGHALAQRLRAAGQRVVTHARHEAEVDCVEPDLATGLAAIEARHGPIDRIVFGLAGPADIEPGCVELDQALGELRSAARLMARRDDSQIWVLLPDDGMPHYLPAAARPARSQALTTAIKAMAKELFRFGVRVNALQVQPLAEQLDAALWKPAKDGLKAYALRFKPQADAEVASLLHGFLALRRLPLAGLVLPAGVGCSAARV